MVPALGPATVRRVRAGSGAGAGAGAEAGDGLGGAGTTPTRPTIATSHQQGLGPNRRSNAGTQSRAGGARRAELCRTAAAAGAGAGPGCRATRRVSGRRGEARAATGTPRTDSGATGTAHTHTGSTADTPGPIHSPQTPLTGLGPTFGARDNGETRRGAGQGPDQRALPSTTDSEKASTNLQGRSPQPLLSSLHRTPRH